MANGEPDPIKDAAKFDKVIDPPATSKVNILQFTVDLDKEVISTNYQTGDDTPDGFKSATQSSVAFYSVDANGLPVDDYKNLYTAMKIDITALIAALQQKI